jgi:uncharacterized protein
MNEPVVFEWDDEKDKLNQEKHGVSFREARKAFEDPSRIIIEDLEHSETEERFFCLGKVDQGILTVRFTYREGTIRIFGAGFWRRGKKCYEEEQGSDELHR